MKQSSITKDLSVGPIYKTIIQFALPIFFGMLFQQFYNLMDMIIVGNFLGYEAMGGIGTTGPINFLVIGLCNGVASGCSISISKAFGQKDLVTLRKYIANGIYVGLITMSILTLAACLLCNNLLTLMDTLDVNYKYAYNYIFFIFLGIPITFTYNFASNILKAVGNSRTPVIILIICIVINVILDFLFIGVFHLGVEFASFATVISQLIAAIACLFYILRKYDFLKIQKGEWKYEYHLFFNLLKVSIPMGLQYSITAIGSIMLTTATNNLHNAEYVAAVSAGGKVNNFVCTPFDALGATMTTFMAQNIGSKQYDRLGKGVKAASVIGIIYSLVALLFILLFGKNLAYLFLKEPTEDIINLTYMYVAITASFYITLVFINVVRFSIQGMEYSNLAIFAGVLEMIGRGTIALYFVKTYGFIAVCFAAPLAWILGDLFLIPCFIILKNKISKKELNISNI